MAFYREGKRCSYLEVIETLNALITKDILLQLEENEVYSFYLRVLEATEEVVNTYLTALDYRVLNMEQAFLALEHQKVISNRQVWKEALALQEAIIAGKNVQDELVRFMIEKLPDAMKVLDKKLER